MYKPKVDPNLISAWSGLTSMNHLGAIWGNKNGGKIMRPERIPIILKKINWRKYIEDNIIVTILTTLDGIDDEVMSRSVEDNFTIVMRQLKSIENEWLATPNSDLREVLRRTGVILNNKKNIEEYMLETGMLNEADITFVPMTHARSPEDKDTIYTPVSELDINFLREIVKDDNCKKEPYYDCVYNELDRKEDELINDD